MNTKSLFGPIGLMLVLSSSLVVSCGSKPPPPVITQIDPAAACDLAPTHSFAIQGTGFLKSDLLPQVTFTKIDNPAITATVAAADTSGCTDQNCTAMTVSVPSAQLPAGRYNVGVKNNCTDDTCLSTQSGPPAQVDIVAPPTLTDISPKVMCSGQGMLTLTGTNFYSGGVVTIGTASSMSLTVNSDGTAATANFAGTLPLSPIDQTTFLPVPLDVTIQNTTSCSSTLPKAVTITPGPSILFVDPPVIPASYSIQATVYAASVASPVKSVQIAPTGTTNFSPVTTTSDPGHPNRVLITLPGNLTAGSYDVQLNDLTTCSATLPNAFKVVSNPTLTVNVPSPSFGAFNQNTAVSITGTGFISAPRAYVAVNGGGSGVSAAALRAVTYTSATALTAVVPSGLAAGIYDLILVNPDGSFGIKSAAFTVAQATQPPPIITSIAPSSVVVATSAAITINGTSFRAPVSLSASCRDAANTIVTGATTTVINTSAQAIAATLNAPTNSVYCILRVQNNDNQTFFDYSAVGVTNNSLNLTGFKPGTNLLTPRRALAASTGRPTQVARFVYAIGGDNGMDNKPYASVEAAATGLDGTLGSFSALSQQLPKALSFLGVVNVGRFLYAVGGFDGTAAVKDVYRAELLDPLNAPQFSDVDVRPNLTQGLSPGLYTYRIAAVLGNGDANNPGGETLASDFFPVQLPAVSMGQLQLLLYWKQVAGAQSYKIYRTVKANDTAGTERLLATVADSGAASQTYIDDGSGVAAGATPLPLGSTGAWKMLAQLNTARAGAGVVAAPDPTTAGTYYLYAAGGNSGSPSTVSLQSSVEYLTITLTNGGAQQDTSATWTTATKSLPTARWLGSAVLGTNAQNNVIPANQAYIYVASGLSSNLATGTLDKKVYYTQIAAGGQPVAFTDSGSVGINGAATGTALVNNQMISFGGLSAGAPTTSSVSANLTMATVMGNFNALGSGVLTVARAAQGTAIESAFIYQLAGLGTGGVVLGSTEQTIW